MALYLQLRFREVGRPAQGDPATGGIAGPRAQVSTGQPTASPTHHAANVHNLPARFLFSELRRLLHFQARPSPLSPWRCPPPPTPAPSPARTGPPRRVPTLHPQRSRRTGRTPVWHSSLGLPGGLISDRGQRDAPVEASAAISCLLGHHPRHLAPPPGPSRPHAPTRSAGAARAATLTEGAGRPPGPPPPPLPPTWPGRFPAADLGQARRGRRAPCVRLETVVQPSSGLDGGRVPGAGGPLRPIRSASPDTKHPNQAAAPRSHILCRHKLSPWGPSQKRQLPNAIISR